MCFSKSLMPGVNKKKQLYHRSAINKAFFLYLSFTNAEVKVELVVITQLAFSKCQIGNSSFEVDYCKTIATHMQSHLLSL